MSRHGSRRVWALGVAGAVTGLLLAAVLLPWWSAVEAEIEAFDDERFRLERMQRLTREAEPTRARADALEAKVGAVTGLLIAPPGARAEAAVNAVMTTTLRQSGGAPRSIRIVADDQGQDEQQLPAGLTRLTAALDAELTNEALLGWLARIDGHPSRPVVAGLTVRATPGAARSSGEPRRLRVSANLQFLVRPEAAGRS